MEVTGLTGVEAARRLAEHGPNEVARHGRVSAWASAAQQLRDPLVVVLLAACVLTLLTGDTHDTAVIAFVIVVNTTVGVTQELRADRAITALTRLSAPSARVRRDGVETSVPGAELVPGDVVVLAEGDVVPADCEVVEESSLLVDESMLTGESVAVGRRGRAGSEAGEALSSGTVLVKGRALALVTATGADSSLGQISALLDAHVGATPLQRRLASLGRTLALVAVGLCGVVFALGLLRGQPVEQMLVTAISLAVAAVPESLPAVVTFSLALGAGRMAAHHAVVRRLAAVETLGSVTVLATDKTGTLTESRMLVERLWTPWHDVEVRGAGYEPCGELRDHGALLDLAEAPDVLELLRACVLCNDARLVAPDHPGAAWSGLGDPTELALLTVAGKAGLTRAELDRRLPRVGELPFDSATQQMTTAHTGSGGDDVLVVTKGSVEALHRAHGEGASPATWHAVRQRADELARGGARVLALTAGSGLSVDDWQACPQRLLGLVAMSDPVKPAARATIEACRTAGIRPVLVTGDHPATARAVALRVGVLAAPGARRHRPVREGDRHRPHPRREALTPVEARPAGRLRHPGQKRTAPRVSWVPFLADRPSTPCPTSLAASGVRAGRGWWSWRESNPRPRASNQVFSGCSQWCRSLIPGARTDTSPTGSVGFESQLPTPTAGSKQVF